MGSQRPKEPKNQKTCLSVEIMTQKLAISKFKTS